MVTGLLALLDDCLWGTVWCHFGATLVSKDWQAWSFRVSFDLVPKSRRSRAGHDIRLLIFWSAGILNEKTPASPGLVKPVRFLLDAEICCCDSSLGSKAVMPSHNKSGKMLSERIKRLSPPPAVR